METITSDVMVVASKIEAMPTNEVNKLISDIARKTKKKRLESGNLFYRDFCKVIAQTVTKQSTRELLAKYNL